MPRSARGGAARSRPRLMAIVALALLNVLVIGAGRRSPGCFRPAYCCGRSRWWPAARSSRPARCCTGRDRRAGAHTAWTPPGCPACSPPALGSHVTAVVADAASGKVLFSHDEDRRPSQRLRPSWRPRWRLLTSSGPAARFTTTVVEDRPAGQAAARSPAQIVLVGGGDPTLAACPRRWRLPPARDAPGAGGGYRPGTGRTAPHGGAARLRHLAVQRARTRARLDGELRDDGQRHPDHLARGRPGPAAAGRQAAGRR